MPVTLGETLGWMAVGALVGGAGGWWLGTAELREGEAPSAKSAPIADPIERPDCRVVDGRDDGVLVEARARLLEASQVLAALTGQLEAVVGTAQAFPDDLDDAYRPDGVEVRITQALQQAGMGELESVDCEEYPCIAVIPLRDADWQIFTQGEHDALHEALDGAFPGRGAYGLTTVGGTGDERTRVALVPLAPTTDNADLEARIRYRLELAESYFDADHQAPE